MERALVLAAQRYDSTSIDIWLPSLLRAELKAGNWLGVGKACDRIRSFKAHASDDRLSGVVLHAQALQLQSENWTRSALPALDEAARKLPMGRWSAYARLDAAW